ncbi:MAG: sulfotransferase [Thermoplasmatales archaeon]|nr:sulfotransferase [Thermoplasmatales archaeon]
MDSKKLDKNYQQIFNPLYYIEKLVSRNKKIDIKDNILLVGSPRSGTTWLMEIFECIPEYSYVFEPLQSNWFPESIKAGFKGRIYLPPDLDWSEGKEFLKKIFNGQIVSRFPPYLYDVKMTMNQYLNNKLIVKSVRLSRLLPWFEKRFQLRGIVFIIRHPCAVIASQIKTGFTGYQENFKPYPNRHPTRKDIVDEASKIDILDSNLIEKLKKIDTLEEILAAAWCLDNIVPLYQKNPAWVTVFYEKLVNDGESELKSIFSRIEEEKSLEFAINILKKPSMLTKGDADKIVKSSELQLSKWKKALSDKQIERILKIVSDFGLDFYNSKIEPDYDNIDIN